jgi:hypothetical protein
VPGRTRRPLLKALRRGRARLAGARTTPPRAGRGADAERAPRQAGRAGRGGARRSAGRGGARRRVPACAPAGAHVRREPRRRRSLPPARARLRRRRRSGRLRRLERGVWIRAGARGGDRHRRAPAR